MENGLGSGSTPNLVEKAMENEIMVSKVEEKAKVGSHESKDSEGEQYFEDSIASEIPAVSSEDEVITQVDDVDNAEVLDGSIVAHKETDGEIDCEQFEEAVEVVDVDSQEEQLDAIEDTDEVFMGIQPVDKPKVEKASNGENVIEKNEENELGIVENDMSAHKKTDSETDYDKFEEAVEIPVDVDNEEDRSASVEDMGEVFVGVEPVDKPVFEEIRGKKEEDEEFVRVENDVAVSKMEDEVIKVTDISTAADDKDIRKEEVVMEVDIAAVCDKEIQEDVIFEKHGNSVSANDVDLEGEVAREISDNGHANVKEISVEKPESAQIVVMPVNGDSSEPVEFVESFDRAEKSEEGKKILSSFDNGHEDKKPCKDEGDAASGIEANGDSIALNTKLEGEKNGGEITKEIAKSINSVHENGTHEETKDNRVGKSEEIINRDLSTPILDHHLTNGKPKCSVEEIEESPVVVLDDVAVEKVENSQANASDKSVNSPDDDSKKVEIFGAKTETDKKNAEGQNGPSEIKPKTNPVTPPARPAGLGRAAPLLETAPRVTQQNRANGTSSHTQSQIVDDLPNGEADENDETREKLQMIRVKFLRLAHRLGQTPHNVVVAQVLYRLGLAEQLRGRNGSRVAGFSFDRASAMAEQLESAGQEPLDFSCTIMVLGKSGVGKSATINSIFDEVKFSTDAFQNGTKKVQDVVGTVQGIKVRVIDTPGLLPSWSDQRQNEKILLSVKKFIKKTPPDIVLYLDRLDMQTRDLGDMPLLRTITDVFGPSIWFNAIVVLTHAASAPPEGSNGTATSYDMFVTNRSHVVQQAIRQAAGDMRLMNPVSLVENHSACRKNRAGQRVLPNGQVWKPHLLLLSFASKILAEANTLLKLQDSPPGRPFGARTRAPPLPFLLSSLLQSRPQLKLPEEQFGDDDEMLDEDIDASSDSDDESALYDELPSFKRLTKEQIGKLSKEQKKAYFAELEYRERLFMRKQLKEEKKRRKTMRKMAETAEEVRGGGYDGGAEEETGGAASVPVPMPDLALPASFDSDNPTHRYRYLDSPNQWVVRPVLDSHGWDHDIGYEGVNVEKLFVVKEKIPMSFSGQITKDKKDANMQMEINSSIKHGEGKGTSLGLDMQSLGKDMAYTLRSETKFINFKKNKATAGLSVTKLGDTVSAGVKIEDQLVVNKRLRLVASAGAMTGRGDMAYGGSFEATLRDKDHPLGRSLSTLGLSVMDWHGDLAIGGNIQSQIPVGRSTNLIARANLNNKGSGQISVRLNSSEQLQIVLVALVPLIQKALGHVQLSQFGQ